MIQAYWVKSQADTWLPLATVNLSEVAVDGVYVIWRPGNPTATIRVGGGNIARRLSEHRRNYEITRFGPLLVTWAAVPAGLRDGIEAYLAMTLHPLVGDAFPDCAPIPVNLPFAA
jgi:hypothetical protein